MEKEEALIITNPVPKDNKSSSVSLLKFIKIIQTSFRKINIVFPNVEEKIFAPVGGNINVWHVKFKRKSNKVLKLFAFFSMQFKIALKILLLHKRNMAVYFWIGDKMLLPYIACKIKHFNIHYFLMGNIQKESGSNSLSARISNNLITTMAERADYLCVESPAVLKEWPNISYKGIIQYINLYVDIDRFSVFIPWNQRKKRIGFLGRLCQGKHVLELIDAFLLFNNKNNDWELDIVGDGPLFDECKQRIKNIKNPGINLYGWVENEKLPEIINTWKYEIFPSSTEGLPNALLESMACATPVIASAVGGICDIISDFENGWFLTDTDCGTIYKTLTDVLNSEENEIVSLNAYDTIYNKYTLKKSRENFINIYKNEKGQHNVS